MAFFKKALATGSAVRDQPINLPRNADMNDVVNRICGYDQKTQVEIDVRKAIEEGYRNLTLSLSMTTNSPFTIPTDAEIRGEHIIVKSGAFTNKGRLNCDVINYGSMGEAVFINRGTYGDERPCSVNMYNARVENYGSMGLKELKFGGRMTLKGDIVAQDVILDHEEGTIGTAEHLEVLNSLVGKFGMLTVSEKIEFKPGSRFVGEHGFRLVCKEGCIIVNDSGEDITALLVVSGHGVLANIRSGSTVTSDAKVWASCYSSMVSEYNRIWRALDNKENKTLALGLAQRFLPADASNPLALLALNECVMGLYSRGPQLSIFRPSDEKGNDAATVKAMSESEEMPDFTGFVKSEMTKFMVDPLREEAIQKLGKITAVSADGNVSVAEADPELVYFFSVNYLCYTVICQYGEEFAAAHQQLYTEGVADEAIARYIENVTSRIDTDGPFFYSLLCKGLVRENVARVYQNYAEQLAKQRDKQEKTAVIASLKSTANQVRIIKINDVDQMDGVEFENLVAALFRKMGFKTVLTPATGDQGIDVVADNGERKIGIQAKCYSGPVGNGAVQEAYSGAKFYKCTEAMVITNNTFTLAARKLADSCGVTLVDRVALTSQLAVFPLRAS